MAEVLVLAEHAEGALKKVTSELITAARVLGEPAAVVVGKPGTAAPLVDGLKAAGAAKIYVAESDTAENAAGGKAARLFTLSAVRGDDGEERAPEIPFDLPMIEAAVAERGARLLVIDPLMAYLTGVDASRDQDVRRALFRLARLAERQGFAVVCLRHLNKTNGDKAIYRGGGSIGIIGAARAGLIVAADPDDPQRRLLAMSKCNLAAPPPPLRFALEPRDGVCRVRWLGVADFEADELLRRLSRAERAEREEVRGHVGRGDGLPTRPPDHGSEAEVDVLPARAGGRLLASDARAGGADAWLNDDIRQPPCGG